MGQTATILLREHVDDDWLLRVARIMGKSPLHHPPCFPGEVAGVASPPDGELTLFEDVNARCPELGYFSHDEEERRSRRIDLRGPTDEDPGPLEMAEALETERAIVLAFAEPDGMPA